MYTRVGILVVWLSLLPSLAHGEERGSAQARDIWIAGIVGRLESSDVAVRTSAEAALGALPVELVVEQLVHRTPGVDQIGRWRRIGVVLGRGEHERTRASLLRARASWPATRVKMLSSLVDRLSPDSVQAKARARKLLDQLYEVRSLSADDPRIEELVSFGRPVVPELARELRERGRMGPGYPYGNSAAKAAVLALRDLIGPRDVPLIARLISDGLHQAAVALDNVDTHLAASALVDTLKSGLLSPSIIDALVRKAHWPVMRATVTSLLSGAHRSSSFLASKLGWVAVAGAYFDLTEDLYRFMRTATEHRDQLALTLQIVRLGDVRGVRALVTIFTLGQPATSDLDREVLRTIGRALNEVAGTTLMPAPEGNAAQWPDFKSSAARIQKWFTERGSKLQFDRESRSWRYAE